MYTLKLLPIAVLVACIPSVMADRCSAIGVKGPGIEGGPGEIQELLITDHESGKTLWKKDNSKDPKFFLCQDYYKVPAKSTHLKVDFGWASSNCNEHYNMNECHGSYGDQTHIKGRKVGKDELKGTKIEVDIIHSACMIDFDCAKA